MKLVICDDEKNIRDMIAECAAEVLGDISIECYPDARIVASPEFDADILFIDIMMPELNGMEAAGKLRENGKNTVIVFVTALEEYVFRAFDVGAFQYIVKPFEHERLKEIISRAADKAREKIRIDKLLTERKNRKINTRTISAKIGSVNMQIPLKDIMYAEVFDRRIVLHMRSGEVIEYYGKISELEKLAGSDFFRIHRAYLINLAYIRSYDHKEVNISDSQIPIARGKHQELVKALLAYHGRERDF